MAEPRVRVIPISDLKADNQNANRGTPRGMGMLESSLQELGAGRSVLVDKDLNLVAGNKTVEKARERGFKEVILVKTDGKQLVAVQREDVELDTPRGRRLALADNRVSQVNLDFDGGVLAELARADKKILDGLWSADELKNLMRSDIEPQGGGAPSQSVGERFMVIVDCQNDEQQRVLIDRLLSEGYNCRASTL